MQHDAFSLRAADDRGHFKGWTAAETDVERARAKLEAWDGVYARNSIAAALHAGLTATMTSRTAMPANPTPQQMEDRLRTVTAKPGCSQHCWGQRHTRAFGHPLLRDLDLPTAERSGGAGTVAADGASYREIFDVSDGDRSQVINVPGIFR